MPAGPGAPAARQPKQQDVPGQGVPGVLAEEDCQGGGRGGKGRHPQLPGTWHQQGGHGGQDIGGRAAEEPLLILMLTPSWLLWLQILVD